MDELPLIGLLKAPEIMRDDILRTFGDEEEQATKFAVKWAWLHRRVKSLDQRTAAERMGIPAPHLSNILNGKKHLPPHKINAFEWIARESRRIHDDRALPHHPGAGARFACSPRQS
jgi:predicted XRE-type DNA-binding protein